MSFDPSRSAQLPFVTVPKRLVDDRGWFSETFRQQQLRERGVPSDGQSPGF